MTAKFEEGTIKGREGGGPALYFRAKLPAVADTKAVLGLLHGYADHAERYDHVVEELVARGVGVVALDMRGHGRSEGARGYCERFDEFLSDALELGKLVDERAKPSGAAKFLFGHSFGGLVATMSMLTSPREYKGLLLSGPFFGLGLEVPALKVLAGKVASRLVPKLGLPIGLTGKDVTHDPERARAYETDPLVFKSAKARWFTETQAAQADAFARAGTLSVPLLEMFGAADHVASPEAGKRFFDAAGHSDKTWAPKPDLFHEILNEPSYKELCAEMADWMLARV
jgi:alpha-beta hydrolase superfamily lysophospholipase